MKTKIITIHNPIWADERVWCKFARRNDLNGAATCPNLCSRPSQRPYCRLNGAERRSPCVFDEPDDATVWREINESVAEYKRMGVI